MDYVSLHSHSTFSVGDGHGPVAIHVDRVKELGMTSLALTEHGNVSSWVQLEKCCKAAGIKPIFGIEIYIADPGVRQKNHMVLLAMNHVGLQNINRLVTRSWVQFYQFPTVYWKDLVQFNEGIIALSGCASSQLSCVLLGGKSYGPEHLEPRDRDIQRAVRGIQRFKSVFGDRYYLEIQRFPDLARTRVLNPLLVRLSEETGVSLCATSDVHYPYPNENAMQRILHAAHRGGSVETADASWEYDILLTYPESDKQIELDLERSLYNSPFEDRADMIAINAVLETRSIAARCNVELPKAPPPRFPIPAEKSAKTLLREWITLGWNHRLEHNPNMQANKAAYKKRMQHEYETICARKGFADYFLMVADLVTWAKDQGIAVGPGRGSAAGSLVCYLLRITEIDSMQYPMLFERFLDPTRTDPPDIDLDFDDERRDEVFAYVASKYGEEKVANIGTFTRYRGKNSIDDIARVYHVPSWIADSFKAKLIDRAEGHPRFAKTIEDTIDTFTDVRKLVDQRPEFKYAIDLEGNIRQFGVHAAGLVVSSVPIAEVCATYEREIGDRVGRAIAFDKYDAAYLGLLKIDILALHTMGEIAKTCELAGISLEELYRTPLNDEDVLEAFRKGDVLGIFQFEGNTTRRILKKVAPTTFMHLSDVNALSRPGADDKKYIANKINTETLDETTGLSGIPEVDAHLSWTYGVVVYEEQILMILRDLGGFDPSELNRMRKVIHDKLGSTAFNEYFQRFLEGAAAHGLSEDAASSIWNGLVGASGYAFNIAHSVSYAHIGYWQQWLKIHYPAEFFTAKLIKCSDDVKRGKLIQEAERHGIDVSPPRLLESQANWTLVGKSQIVAGFTAIPGIGEKTSANIIRWRDECIGDEDEVYWDDLIEVKGIGAKTISTIRNFCESDDPFGVHALRRKLEMVREAYCEGELEGIPQPTHVSIDIPPEREWVCYMGVARKKKYYDAVEQLQKRTPEDLSYEDALLQIRDSHLLKYVALEVEDDHGETVMVRINRWKYPDYAGAVSHLKLNSDVVVAQGYSSDFGGISIQTDQLVVLEV